MTELFIGLGLIAAFRIGYEFAHYDIATECERLGGFFVGKKVFKCVQIINEKEPSA